MVVSDGQIQWDYKYDEAGLRIFKDDGTAKEFYLRDHTGKVLTIYDLNDNNRIKMANLYGDGLLGRVEVDYDDIVKPPLVTYERYYYLKDHLGSIRLTIDENGNKVHAQDYYPFGEVLREYTTTGIEEKYKFTGKERDFGTEYDYFGARYYDSFLGRWLSVDPLSALYPGWSPYNYSLNNPINLTDILGLGAVRSDPAMKPVGLINQNWWSFSPQFVAPSVFENPLMQNTNADDNAQNVEAAQKLKSESKKEASILQIINSLKDFKNQYLKMRDENVIGNDHFHHAMANSRATLRGPYGRTTAIFLSNARELMDLLKGDIIGEVKLDLIANQYGRLIPNNVSPTKYNSIFNVLVGGKRGTLSGNNVSTDKLNIYSYFYYMMRVTQYTGY